MNLIHPIIPWTPVITTLIQHQSCLLSSRHANHLAILMYWDTKKEQGTDRSCVTIVSLQNILIVHIIKVENVVPAINRILIWFDWFLALSLETVFTKSTNNLSMEMTAPASCKPLLVCGTGIYLGSFDHPLYGELKHLFNRCDSRANSTHTTRAKVCKLRVEMHFPSQY